jgi:RimJ/RimL family protein N-acetyltransferase/ADP-ribose pyrophosphatase YjhB (NUDIX family)
VRLRPVVEGDLDAFFAHQADPEAARVAAFDSRPPGPFLEHWHRILADPSGTTRTIEEHGAVVGNVVAWSADGERLVGYWLGREFWGRGLATAALKAFLGIERTRPLRARVARTNVGSIRVLEKAGFERVGGDDEELVFELAGPPAPAPHDHAAHRNPIPVAVVIPDVEGGDLLLVRRALPPAGLALPGGYIDYGEDWRAAAVRELAEETGIRADALDVEATRVRSAPDGTLLVFGTLAEPLSAAAVRAAVDAHVPDDEIAGLRVATRTELRDGLIDELVFPLHRDAVHAHLMRGRPRP